MSKTIAIIKPDAVRRLLVGEIVTRINTAGLRVEAMRLVQPTIYIPGTGCWNPFKFYSLQHEEKPYFEDLVAFMCSGPSVAALLTEAYPGTDVIGVWRATMGSFRDRVPGTIRGDLMMPDARPMENLVHGSDSAESFAWEYSCLEGVL